MTRRRRPAASVGPVPFSIPVWIPTLVALVALCTRCHVAQETDRWPCPADGVIRARSGLCECDVDGRAFFASGWGKACRSCNAQDGNGDSCVCEDGTLMRNDTVECLACPEDCGAIECVPEGCALVCESQPRCVEGSTCSADAVCIPCEPGMCGGGCGLCPLGEICLEGSCEPGLLCCLQDNTGKICSRRADFCVVPPLFQPRAGAPCFCNVLNGESLDDRCGRSFRGTIVAAGATCE